MYFPKFDWKVHINMKLNYASDLFSWKYRINMSKIETLSVVLSIYEMKSGPDYPKTLLPLCGIKGSYEYMKSMRVNIEKYFICVLIIGIDIITMNVKA